ncbi:hypothetical protein [Marinospirillum alkaliphilum]|uniref:PilZ domain-containing protein n=1 Tax=Marinospirillum alkaliphilum DSM 21637 TaxID=1122209 RepID=A0A1K1ZGH3_9GAMM|nr:hypothetical protein [Marinospirillum alkaliphilum]SFX72811.1 hypothetical protein SAMN02745752_02662 [Marinospirillum alkaliphilum DSM 21637]
MSQPMTLTTTRTPVTASPGMRRNRYPLMSLEFPVHFALPDGNFSTYALELSHEEVRVACDSSDIPLLVPRTAHHRPDEKIIHQALLVLNERTPLEAHLQVLTCRRFSQKTFHVAFRILDLDEQGQSQLEKCLQRALQTNTSRASLFG